MTSHRLLAACLLLLPGRLAAEPVDYLRDVKPLLTKNCAACHGAAKQRAGLRLDTAQGLRQGGNSGPAIVPSKAVASLLIKAVTGAADAPAMPPKGPKLTDAEVRLLRAWIDAGAPAPAEEVAGTAAARPTHWAFVPPVGAAVPAVGDAGWCRTPLDRFILARLEKEGLRPSPEADPVTLLRRVSLDLTGLPPTPEEVAAFEAEYRATPQAAYARAVDRLLASPHYGERWGRLWLDQARYADSNGFNIDAPRTMWKYRDWVITALNADVPFDRFTVEQLAGDLLPNATLEQKIATGFHRNTLLNQEGGIDVEQFRVESVVDRVNTTGAVWLGLTVGCAQCHDHKFDPLTTREYYQLFAFFNNADEPTLELLTPEEKRSRDAVRRQVAALEKRRKVFDPTTDATVERWEAKLSPEERAKLPAAVRTVLELPENGRDARQKQTLMTAHRKADMVRHVVAGIANPWSLLQPLHLQAVSLRLNVEKEIAALKKKEPAVTTALVMQERAVPRVTHVHLGGDFLRQGVQVRPGLPSHLTPPGPPFPEREGGELGSATFGGSSPRLQADLPPSPLRRGGAGGGEVSATRLDLARWIVDRGNPLTARVTVNRVWQHYFGVGLVETENDFGTQGTPPSHPELLDWLAVEFMERGWGLKDLHRLIVTSAVYRQASRARPELATVDPRNRLLARQNRLRLDAEIVRDAALAASGRLCRTVGGPSVFPPQPDGVFRFTQVPRDWKPSGGPDRYRRGLYTYFWRSAPHPALTVFDAPGSTTACTRRLRSNTPLQALTLLNDQAFVELAQGLAARILAEGPADDAGRLAYAYRACLGRSPSPTEARCLGQLLAEQMAAFTAAPEEARPLVPPVVSPGEAPRFAAWVVTARVLLNLDEFITRE